MEYEANVLLILGYPDPRNVATDSTDSGKKSQEETEGTELGGSADSVCSCFIPSYVVAAGWSGRTEQLRAQPDVAGAPPDSAL